MVNTCIHYIQVYILYTIWTQGVTVHNKFLRIQMYYFYVCVTQSSKYTRTHNSYIGRICTLCIYVGISKSFIAPKSQLVYYVYYMCVCKRDSRARVLYTLIQRLLMYTLQPYIHLYKTETQRRVSIIYVAFAMLKVLLGRRSTYIRVVYMYNI